LTALLKKKLIKIFSVKLIDLKYKVVLSYHLINIPLYRIGEEKLSINKKLIGMDFNLYQKDLVRVSITIEKANFLLKTIFFFLFF
jgi:hypothetical protein